MSEPAIGAASSSSFTVRVRLRDPGGGAIHVREVASTEFEPTDRGVTMGRTFVPWYRVMQYDWTIPQGFAPEADEDRPKARVRAVIDDGSPGGVTHVVAAEVFEAGPWTLGISLDRKSESGDGFEIQKLFVPWHRVVEYERLPPPIDA